MLKLRTVLVAPSLLTMMAFFASVPLVRADIFQWQYINPANPSLGRQQSTTLCPSGAGANSVPGALLRGRILTKAYFIGANLTQARFGGGGTYENTPGATLTDADFSHANLTNAEFGGYAGLDPNDPGIFEYYYLGADLTGASLVQANLTGASFVAATLTNANLSHTKLNASFRSATLTGANLTGADVRGTDFNRASVYWPPYYEMLFGGITLAQLYSTASYQAHDLTGIGLGGNLLSGANLADQNLASANFSAATLTGANLTGAEIRSANFNRKYLPDYGYTGGLTPLQLYSTASYLAHDLNGIVLDGNGLMNVNFAGFNLTNASFSGATLINADFSHAYLANAGLRAHLSGANLAYANLTSADFSAVDGGYHGADLSGANLSHARLTNAKFDGIARPIYDEDGILVGEDVFRVNLSSANLSGADARGASFQFATLTGVNTTNLIQSDGHIAGLDLTAGATLIVRDYDGNASVSPPTGTLPIVVEQHLAMDATGTLRLVFDPDPWDSTISFAPGIPVTLGGTLELTFASEVDVATQAGRTIDLFDWTGVTPTGAFTVSSPYAWNLSNLYTTGEITLTAVPGVVPGDFNNNGIVDAADYVVWRKGLGTTFTQTDYNVWRAHFGQTTGSGTADFGELSRAVPSADPLSAAVPEPTSFAVAVVLVVGLAAARPSFGVRIPRPNSHAE